MSDQNFSILILAAGKATRFKSEHSKMLHRLAGQFLGEHILQAAQSAKPDCLYMVIGHEKEQLRKDFARPGLVFIEQNEQLGTGHAVMMAREELEKCPSAAVLVLVGDAPLLPPETLVHLVEIHRKARAAATILTTHLDYPTGYGRIARDRDRVRSIVEEKVATPDQKRIREINSGIICFSRTHLLKHLGELTADNAQKEFLLTDLIEIFNRHRLKVTAFPVADSREVLGANDRVELAQIERHLRLRKAVALMRQGVTVVDPQATYIDPDVEVGQDTVIEPGASLLGRTRLGRDCHIQQGCVVTDSSLADRVTLRPYCVISNSEIGAGAALGPFARLRENALIEENARIGNFVEVKKSRVGRGSKAQHLTYLGDATLGQNVNIGAGTITCNYDGVNKYPTAIEDGVFIGSGNMLVAPVRVGHGSYTGAGSTISEDVPPDSLAIARSRQVTKQGWVKEHKRQDLRMQTPRVNFRDPL